MVFSPVVRHRTVICMFAVICFNLFYFSILFAVDPYFLNKSGYAWFPYRIRRDHPVRCPPSLSKPNKYLRDGLP